MMIILTMTVTIMNALILMSRVSECRRQLFGWGEAAHPPSDEDRDDDYHEVEVEVEVEGNDNDKISLWWLWWLWLSWLIDYSTWQTELWVHVMSWIACKKYNWPTVFGESTGWNIFRWIHNHFDWLEKHLKVVLLPTVPIDTLQRLGTFSVREALDHLTGGEMWWNFIRIMIWHILRCLFTFVWRRSQCWLSDDQHAWNQCRIIKCIAMTFKMPKKTATALVWVPLPMAFNEWFCGSPLTTVII